MRLTLRALLGFLDGVPMAAEEQARIQAVLESAPDAKELVLRIRTLLSQARMASPAVETAGTLQLNQVAEYLDGTLDLEATKRFEQACLKNDSALSEVAALHQILSAWIDQPTEISESLRQRVYSFAGSWEPAATAESEVLPTRSAGRDALQAAAELLQIRELDETPNEEGPANSRQITQSLPDEKVERRRDLPRVPVGTSGEHEPESSSSGSWVLVVLAILGVGILWWNQSASFHSSTHSVEAIAEPDPESPAAEQIMDTPIRPIKLPSLPQIDSEPVRSASPSTLPPITFSSASSLNTAESNPAARPSGDLPIDATRSQLPLEPFVLDSTSPSLPNMQLDLVPELIPSLAMPPETELAANETITTDALENPDNSESEVINAQVGTGGDRVIGQAIGSADTSIASPLQPRITELPPVEEETSSAAVASGLAGNRETAKPSEAFSTPLVAALVPAPATPAPATAVTTAPLTPSPAAPVIPASEPPATSAPEPPATAIATPARETGSPETPALGTPALGTTATAIATPALETPAVLDSEAPAALATSPVAATSTPYEWGQQVGTVVVEDMADAGVGDWILVLPGGRSQLQVRSPQGRSWRFSFSGVSRYQLLENQGRYYLSVQRCFMVFESQAANESLEIMTPKGKLFITSLAPNTKVIVEVRPFLPQGSTAETTNPRYYLGCLGVQGRAIIEHQQKEELIFADKWLVVKPDGEHESFQAEMPAAIAQALRDMTGTPVAEELQQLDQLVQSHAGFDELANIVRGNSSLVANVSRDVRSLAAMWSYCLGRFEPAFDILNDPQMRDYWETHIQAVASCLQSDRKALAQLTLTANRIGISSSVESGFVGLNAQTVKRSQVAELIAELESPQVVRRVLALQTLKSLTNQTFDFDPERSSHLNRDSIQKWRQWLEDSTQARLSVTPSGGLVPSASR